jgi:protein required for attachment to host cells
MMLPHNTTVAVVDGKTLNLFQNSGHEGELSLKSVPAPTLHAVNAGSGGRHQSSSGNPDASHQSEDGFAAAAAAWLNRQVLDGKIEALVVIAAPKTLGELRKHYHKQLEAVLEGELSKDLVGRPVADVVAAIHHH